MTKVHLYRSAYKCHVCGRLHNYASSAQACCFNESEAKAVAWRCDDCGKLYPHTPEGKAQAKACCRSVLETALQGAKEADNVTLEEMWL